MKNIVLISQVGITIMVPAFLCLALGLWLDNRFNTWFAVPLLFIGLAAGGRNAYILLKNTIHEEETKKKKNHDKMIQEKIDRYNNKRQ